MSELTSELESLVKAKLQQHMAEKPLVEVASLSWVQELALEAMRAMSRAVFEVWVAVLVVAVQGIGLECPRCGRRRKLKMRSKHPMHIDVLGQTVQLPKPYLECGHCDAPGLSVLRLLTGLSSGEASVQLKLLAAYCASKASYGKARQEMQIHHGPELERTKLRRMALEVEQEAMAWAEGQRQRELKRLEQEARQQGVDALITEGDGGKVRTGELVACEAGDAGWGKTTPKRGLPRRKRPTTWREMITIDVRKPGAQEPSALDVLVPVLSPPGERARRMLATASRSGLGDNTAVWGLGDMGSELASSFDEAFAGYRHQGSASAIASGPMPCRRAEDLHDQQLALLPVCAVQGGGSADGERPCRGPGAGADQGPLCGGRGLEAGEPGRQGDAAGDRGRGELAAVSCPPARQEPHGLRVRPAAAYPGRDRAGPVVR
jgi:hypothetical protein